jgi:hypothetical protein
LNILPCGLHGGQSNLLSKGEGRSKNNHPRMSDGEKSWRISVAG